MSAPDSKEANARVVVMAAICRAAAFLGLWFVLSGIGPSQLTLAAPVAVIGATWLSLRLLPPGGSRGSLVPLIQLVVRFPQQTVVAGVDVAWRALDPRLPLRPGLVTYPVRFPPGAARNAFCTLTCLVPGTLPVGTDENDALIIHCLDVKQPIAAQLSAEEALLARVLGGGRGHG